MKKPKTSLRAALLDNPVKEGQAKLESDIKTLFETLSGYDLADAVIARVQRYAVEALGKDMDSDFEEMSEDDAYTIQDIIRKELESYISSFILDEHREFVVRAHARGGSTSEAVMELMCTDTTINRLAQDDAMGIEGLRKELIVRMSYLKPGTVRWPEKKYGVVWREAREEYKQAISDIPLTSTVEHIALLSKQVERINRKLENQHHDLKGFQFLANMLTETMKSVRELTVVEEPVPTSLSAPQLVAFLQRVTLALGAPGKIAIGGETEELVGVLEQLTLALKAPVQKTGGNGANALPAPNGNDGGNAD